MQSFKFYFGLNLSQRLYEITNNLSKNLQKQKMSALRGKELAGLTLKTLEGMRNDRDFGLFYERIKLSAKNVETLLAPAVPPPRKGKRPNYSIRHYYAPENPNAAEAYQPESPFDYYKPIYYEALDSVVNAIKDRFNQPAFQLFSKVEQLLLLLEGDYDEDSINAELQLLPTIFKGSKPINLEGIISVLSFHQKQRRNKLLTKKTFMLKHHFFF